MPPPMAFSISSSSLAALPFAARLPAAAPRLPAARSRALTAGYAATYYGDGAAANGDDEAGSASGFGIGGGLSAAEAMLAMEEREMPPCPLGLRQYESMVVLRPDMSEEECLALIQRYEEEVEDLVMAHREQVEETINIL